MHLDDKRAVKEIPKENIKNKNNFKNEIHVSS